MRKPDEIMADYLLKGGKMLAKTCNQCQCPLFEYKGETFCVVCREQNAEKINDENIEKPVMPVIEAQKNIPDDQSDLIAMYEHTIKTILEKAEKEQDTRAIATLMKAASHGAEAINLLQSGYCCRDRE